MNSLYNLILDQSGYKPVTDDSLKPVLGASWYNFVKTDKWEKDGKIFTMKEAIKIIENENINGATQ